MGAWIIKDFIEISDKTRKGTILECFSYKEIDETFICAMDSTLAESFTSAPFRTAVD